MAKIRRQSRQRLFIQSVFSSGFPTVYQSTTYVLNHKSTMESMETGHARGYPIRRGVFQGSTLVLTTIA